MAWQGPDPIVSNALAELGIATAYYPLKGPMRTRGVLALNATGSGQGAFHARGEFFQAVASVVAIALERLHYVEVAEGSRLETASERLRSSVLSALSHDLRTPLTALVGLADTLKYAQPPLPDSAREAVEGISEQALGMSSLVTNLLDMARLHAGPVRLHREWQLLEEAVGASTRALGPALAGHELKIDLARDLPLVEFDAVLIERVLCNLLDNAAKYAPAGTVIEISACRDGPMVRIAVCDRGPGFPPGRQDELFGMFRRGTPESAKPGVGLGLAICRTIVEAHGGEIAAANRDGGGACVAFTLPLGTPPVIDEEPAAAGGGGRP
jgi:two-component system sensor histidine kinase KdpD